MDTASSASSAAKAVVVDANEQGPYDTLLLRGKTEGRRRGRGSGAGGAPFVGVPGMRGIHPGLGRLAARKLGGQKFVLKVNHAEPAASSSELS